MKVDLIPPAEGQYNLKNYDEAYANFNWADVEKQFSWYETGKVNIAYEAIDRHLQTERRDKIALLYTAVQRRDQG